MLAEATAPPPEGRLTRTFMPVEVWNGTLNPDWDLLAADRLVRAGFPAVPGQPDRRITPRRCSSSSGSMPKGRAWRT